MTCTICHADPVGWSWTDTHGIAQCVTCGTPYRILHYDGESSRRLDKPPELLILPEYVPAIQAYWNEQHRRMPGGFSFHGGQEIATNADSESFRAWMKTNAEKHKAQS